MPISTAEIRAGAAESSAAATFRTLADCPAEGKRVLVRADLNVPAKDGVVTDGTRIDRLLPTLRALQTKGARIIVLSHFGRPKAGVSDSANSLRPIAAELEKRLGSKVAFAPDCIGSAAKSAVERLGKGQVLVLENLRFHAGEEANDPAFAKELADLGDLYVNDAFSAAHRAHASISTLPRLRPAYAGLAMADELRALDLALGNPARPLAAIVGGAKVSTKLALLGNLSKKVDYLILGGGMANTFLAAAGVAIGKSLYEPSMLATARTIALEAETRGCRLILPKDAVTAAEFKANVPVKTVPISSVPEAEMILDVGPASVTVIARTLAVCKTLVWNGPLGAFETPPFEAGTVAVAMEAARLTEDRLLTAIAGGGDTVSALAMAGVTDRLSYVSTAGGAFLEWMEGIELPGVSALKP